MALALARRPPALHHQATLDAVGLKKGSVMRAVEGLLARGDAIAGQGCPASDAPARRALAGRAHAGLSGSPPTRATTSCSGRIPYARATFTDELPGAGL
jgi:hypothetical protein